MTHTAGPWKAIPRHEYDGWGILAEAGKDGAGWVMYFDGAEEGEMDANAALIAEAPNMYEVLEYIATEGSDCPPNEEPATFYRNQLLACIGHAARAIAKAEGR